MIVIDSSGLLAAIDSKQRDHQAAKRALDSAEPPLLLSPFVLAELDYFLANRVGATAETALLEEVAAGAYQLEPFDAQDVDTALEYVRQYRNIELGLADASVMVLAARHAVFDVLTLDERHFRTVRAADGRSFRLLPADAESA